MLGDEYIATGKPRPEERGLLTRIKDRSQYDKPNSNKRAVKHCSRLRAGVF